MKMRALFNLVEDAQGISDLFARVESPEQMVSTLERVKKQHAPEFLELIESLRFSLEAVFSDTLELGGTIDEGDFDGEPNEGEGEDLLGKIEAEEGNPPQEKSTEEAKS